MFIPALKEIFSQALLVGLSNRLLSMLLKLNTKNLSNIVFMLKLSPVFSVEDGNPEVKYKK